MSMRIDWDVPVEMDDGTVLRADVFRPDDDDRHPVLMTHGPYGKGLAFQEGFAGMWHVIEAKYPDVPRGSSNRYQNWEAVDPDKWVPDGYVCVRVDSRGAGALPGTLTPCRPARHGTSTSASNGRALSRGATARSGCSASPTTP